LDYCNAGSTILCPLGWGYTIRNMKVYITKYN
jgi:hypothetical protein